MKKNVKKAPAKKKSLQKTVNSKEGLSFPSNLVSPISLFLQGQLKVLARRKKEVERDDPFRDTDRVFDNASMDDDAAEQYGHARSIAIKDQLERRMIQIKKALTKIKVGRYGICDDCGNMIDTDRLMIEPEATLCAKCQRKREK